MTTFLDFFLESLYNASIVETTTVIWHCFGVGIGGRCSEEVVIAVEMPKDSGGRVLFNWHLMDVYLTSKVQICL